MFKKGNRPWSAGLTKETDERIRRIAELKIGKKRSPETVRKISDSIKGEKHPNYGKHHSPETRRKISEGRLKKEDPKNLLEHHMQIIFGSILGDANLGKGNGVNFYLDEVHSTKQKKYLLWKNNMLEILGSLIINENRNVHKRVRLKTKSFPFLKELHEEFYPDGKKIIPINIINKLNGVGLMIWYLDDGHVTIPESLITLSTDGYTYEGNLLVQKFFIDKLDIHPRIGKRSGKYYYLLFNKKDSKKLLCIFKELFEKYNLPRCMFYKLGDFWEGNREKIKLARKKKNIYKRKWRKKRSEERKKIKLKELKFKGEKIRKLYWDTGLDSREIGKIIGYSSGGIRKIMKKLDIPIRTPSEAKSGERNPFYGRHHTKESKEKIAKNRWKERGGLK